MSLAGWCEWLFDPEMYLDSVPAKPAPAAASEDSGFRQFGEAEYVAVERSGQVLGVGGARELYVVDHMKQLASEA